VNLLWADYEKKVMDSLGEDYGALNEFNVDYNRLYSNLGLTWAKRYILTPPDGRIGGHCLVPNAKLLNDQFPDDILKRIIEMEE
jgi:hypothetical protein